MSVWAKRMLVFIAVIALSPFAAFGVSALVTACGTPKQTAIEKAELSCLVTAGAEFSQQAIAAGAGTSDGKIAVSLSIPTVLCMLQALGAQPPVTSTALPARVDAGAP